MITIEIPGREILRLENLLLDFNGTLAEDGRLLAGVDDRIRALHSRLAITVITADTFGRVRSELRGMPGKVVVVPRGEEDAAKAAHVRSLGAEATVAVGNGRNDRHMLAEAALAIVVMQGEGMAREALEAADVVYHDVRHALDALLYPERLVATLRS
jgi:soluble P-type ATPase